MTESVILQASVAIATIWENKARATGRLFWKVVLDSGDTFTAFQRELVAQFINGRPSQQRNESLVYNFDPPLNTVVYFEANPQGKKVLVPAPPGAPDPPVAISPPAAGSATTQIPPVTFVPTPMASAGVQKEPYRPYGGGQKSGGGWKPEDKRPSLLTMTESYVKDGLVAIIAVAEDIKTQDPDTTATWFADKLKAGTGDLLAFNLEKLKALGFKLEPDGYAK